MHVWPIPDSCSVGCARARYTEGDRNAYSESSKATIEANRQAIVGLRRENKELGSRLRKLKNPPNRKHGAGVGHKQVSLLDHKVRTAAPAHRELRSYARTHLFLVLS